MRIYDYIIVGAALRARARQSPDESGSTTVCCSRREVAHESLDPHSDRLRQGDVRREVNWMFETEPEPRMNGRTSRCRAGACSAARARSTAALCRGQREDYDDWRDSWQSGWGYADCRPYFKKSEDQARGADDWHGVGGPLSVSDVKERHRSQTFIEAGEAAGIRRHSRFNGASQEGGLLSGTARNGLRCSAAVAYLRPAMRRSTSR